MVTLGHAAAFNLSPRTIPKPLSADERGEHGASSERRLLRFFGSRTLDFGCCSLEIPGAVKEP